MSDAFVARQTANLQQLVRAGDVQKKPEQLRTREEQQLLTIQSSPCRCLRCGDLVYPIIAMPGPFLCEPSRDEVRQRDQQDIPGCRWWGELLHAARSRNPEKTA